MVERDWEKYDREVRYVSSGSQMSLQEATQFSKQLLSEPDNLECRLKLLGYYFLKANKSASAKAARYEHVRWMIKHHPDHYVSSSPWVHLDDWQYSTKMFAAAREIFKEQALHQPENAALIANFGHFVIQRDLHTGLELLQKACKLDDTEEGWPQTIILFCSFAVKENMPTKYKRKYAELALTYAAAATKMDHEYLANYQTAFENLSICALYLDDFETAADCINAFESIETRWQEQTKRTLPDAIRGTIALRQGNLEKACRHLLNLPKGILFDHESTNLANELLQHGQFATVAEFIKRLLKHKIVDYKLNYWRYWLSEIEKENHPPLGDFRSKIKKTNSKTNS
jgi:tetratricopeptide (TPR) repeat protein